MKLSDTITDRVVYLINVILNQWNGDGDDVENDDEVDISHENFFTVEDLNF
jgi:hypothetical protein